VWSRDAERVDVALYAAVARAPTPALDVAMSRLSNAANHSRLWIAAASLLAALGGRRGRRAAAVGLLATGVSSVAVNMMAKPIALRRRPDRVASQVPFARHVRMPVSGSFPPGHAASAFAFVTGVGHVSPPAAAPLRALAAVVAYSRVHTGVHYPGDVVIGAMLGSSIAQVVSRSYDRRRDRRHR
jgi:membrane-associated phospholipid phosphatase